MAGQEQGVETQNAGSPQGGNGFASMVTGNNTSTHRAEPGFLQWGEHTDPSVPKGLRKVTEKGSGQATAQAEGKGVKESARTSGPTEHEHGEGFQSGIITELPHRLSTGYVLHEGRGDNSKAAANVSTNTNPTSNVTETKLTGTAGQSEGQMSQLGSINYVTPNTGLVQSIEQGPAGSLGTQKHQEPNKAASVGPVPEGAHASGPTEKWTSGASETTEKGTSDPSLGMTNGGLPAMEASSQETQRANSNQGRVDLVTLGGMVTSRPGGPAVSKEKDKSAPLVGITIKQSGQPDKYVLVNKRHKLRAKHHAHRT